MYLESPTTELQSIEKLREQDLDEARVIQSGMLPSQPLHVGPVIISHEFQPVAEVGGDYLDYFSLADGKIGLYIGDVSGKGLPAALYAALAVGTLRGVHKTGQEPGSVLALLNKRLLVRGIPARHTAIQYAVFDPQLGQMKIASAGMPGPILIRGKECEVLQIAGLPPGLFPNVTYDEFTLQLEPGDSLLFCTDGLTNARNRYDQEFNLDGLQDVCRRHAQDSPIELLNHVFNAIQEFTVDCRQFDDMAAAVFRYSTPDHFSPSSGEKGIG